MTVATPPLVLPLDGPEAVDAALTGAKASKLAIGAAAGLPTLPGFVLTTAATAGGTETLGPALEAARERWHRLSGEGERPLVVRSSSTVEDATSSSMAGRFTSILDVRGWDAFVDSVGRVLASAHGVAGPGQANDMIAQPMAVLVQPMLEPSVGGVLFGVDPVTGDARHLVAEAVVGGPDALVSGRVTAVRYLLDRRGRLIESDAGDGLLGRRDRLRLARLAARARKVFAAPQDIEWAIDDDGLWLLQSRPVTATGDAVHAVGPVLGPGPVGETFPDPLRPLEVDLWVEPLRRGMLGALRAAGAVTEARLSSSPIVLTVGGRVAADLDLLGVRRDRPSPLRRLDPRGPARHLATAWRVGRLRAGLPRLADDILDCVDVDLASVPPLSALTDRQLLGVIGRARVELASVHGYEILAGMLMTERRHSGTAAGVALRALARARARGRSDDEIVVDDPIVLMLTAPRVGGDAALPDVEPGTEHVRPAPIGRREGLRLRARWLQELLARAAWEAGRRLTEAGRTPDPEAVVALNLAELVAVVDGAPLPEDLDRRLAEPAGPPLPSAFRLTRAGRIVPAPSDDQEGRGAGGGRGTGRIRHVDDLANLERGDVLVVRTLEPQLAAVLPELGGLVAETGSTLSHLAILARELGVPTVVGVDRALERFPNGMAVLVDGTTGDVDEVPSSQNPSSADGPPSIPTAVSTTTEVVP